MPDLKKNIEINLEKIGIPFTETKVKKLNDYLNMLEKWNKTYNLTSVRDINEMLERHLMDSLSIVNYIKGERLIDIGTGAGLPGIPLAIMYPEKQFALLDSNGKKTRFLNQVKNDLALLNVEVIYQRAENYKPSELFDSILSRAFSSLEEMLKYTEHLCKANGYYYAMKGVYPTRELQLINKLYKTQPLTWAGNNTERHLIIISQQLEA